MPEFDALRARTVATEATVAQNTADVSALAAQVAALTARVADLEDGGGDPPPPDPPPPTDGLPDDMPVEYRPAAPALPQGGAVLDIASGAITAQSDTTYNLTGDVDTITVPRQARRVGIIGNGFTVAGVVINGRWNGTEAPEAKLLMRGKTEARLDLKEADARDVVRDLAETADIVIDNLGTGRASKFGIDYRDVAKANAQVVYVALPGFGEGDPMAGFPASR